VREHREQGRVHKALPVRAAGPRGFQVLCHPSSNL
jgi:hypothetical protein